jgi:hypothetical protein
MNEACDLDSHKIEFLIEWLAKESSLRYLPPSAHFKHSELIRASSIEMLFASVWPLNVNPVDLQCRAKTKMQRRIVAREIARGWLKQCPPSSSACLDDCFGADGVASAVSWIDKANSQPVAAPGRNVAVNARRAGDPAHDQIGRAVVVEIAHRQAPSHERLATKGNVAGRNIAELPAALIREELRPLRVTRPPRRDALEHGRLTGSGAAHETVDECQVKSAIEIEVRERRAETGTAPGLLLKSGARDCIGEQAAGILAEERMKFLREMRDE